MSGVYKYRQDVVVEPQLQTGVERPAGVWLSQTFS